MGIDVEGHRIVLIHLNVKLLQTIFAKDSKDHVTRILSGNLDNEILRHP